MKNNNEKNYPGAEWWKFDFHTHTPASTDFMKGCSQEEKKKVTPEYWLEKFVEEGINCVAVTDHNSGEWIDKLKDALKRLKNEQPDRYRRLYLFPGVEISVSGGVHVLAIFDSEKTTRDIYSLLGAVGYGGTIGDTDKETKKSITEVIDIIAEHGGIPIPAHVDQEKGLFKISEVSGNTLKQVLENDKIIAMELCDKDSQKPRIYIEKKLHWTEIVGSDTHRFENSNFGRFTWIKMDTPSMEGLRLALIDGEVSVNRDMDADPNQHSAFILEELKIENAKYIGGSYPIVCRFSPFLNTIIGGRGSGKSTLLEFMRLILRRDKEIPDDIKEDKYFQAGDDGLLTKDSKLSLIYSKNKIRYRLNWSVAGDVHPLEIEKGINDWDAEVGEIATLFPVHIYSQKQIFELSSNPQGLLGIIDKDEEVDCERLKNEHTKLCNEYKRASQEIREITDTTNRKKKLQGELNDITRQIDQIEKSGHKLVLLKYRYRKQQLNIIESVETKWKKIAERLVNTKEAIEPVNFNKEHFNESQDILSALEKNNEKWIKIGEKLASITEEARELIGVWVQEKGAAEWKKSIEKDMLEYDQLKTQLKKDNIDPEKYPLLLQKQAAIKNELSQIEAYSSKIESLENTKNEKLTAIEKNRKLLNENRQTFLSKVLKGKEVSMKVKPFAEKYHSVKENIRWILQCYRFDKDIDALMEIYERDGYQKMKNELMDIYKGKRLREELKDQRFLDHLKRLPQESIDDFQIWFPEDNLVVTPANRQSFEQGSPGQKCAALLAFILAYGDTPLLLDQPEDDLDNELIYDLIVTQIQATKSDRQIIVITHNANIVVNGNAEMVIPLRVGGEQTRTDPDGSIQNEIVREKICAILEGGKYAFDQRHRRIHLER